MPYLGTEVLGFSDILDFKSDILFFFWAISAPETVFKKKKGYHKKKKDITPYILRFFGSKHPYNISQKTSANGEKRCSKKNFISILKFFEIGGLCSMVFWKKNVWDFFFCKKCAKKGLYLGKFRKKNLDWGWLFCLILAKKNVGGVILLSWKYDRISKWWSILTSWKLWLQNKPHSKMSQCVWEAVPRLYYIYILL